MNFFFKFYLYYFFFMMCEFSYILYPLTGMSGAFFHQWFLRASCLILHFPHHP